MKRVLIVDDSIELGRVLQDTLRLTHPDLRVSVVPSAEEGLLEATRLTIDLLVADLRLPGMSGGELIRKIRIRQPDVKVIMITGLALDQHVEKTRAELHPDIFLHKPIAPGVFLNAVEKLIGEIRAPGSVPDSQPAPIGKPGKADDAILRELAKVMPGEAVVPSTKTTPLRKGTGSLRMPPAVSAPAPVEEGLSAVLSRLRGSLGAVSAALIDERGHPVAQAGDLPDFALEGQLIPPLMASLSAGAKISYLLGQAATQSVQAYRGANFDLLAAPVGQFTLLISIRASQSTLRLALAFEEVLNAQVEISSALEAMGLRIQSTVEVGPADVVVAEMSAAVETQEETIPPEVLATPLGQDQGLEKLEELFIRKQTGELQLQDPDAFWDQVSAGEGKEVSQPGVLTLDQAQKLGLMPPE